MSVPFALELVGAETGFGAQRMRFDLGVPVGEWLAVIGPSGAGKSTMLDIAAGFLTPDRGSVRIDGRDATRLPPAERPLSVVFQDNNLFAHLDVFRNVALGVSPWLRLDAETRARVHAALEAVGLAGFEARRPAEMSGGERQRVALARAFSRDRPLLLLDEPFAALGPGLRHEMATLVSRRRAGAAPLTVVMVTHQPEDARGFADRIAFVEDGRVARIGSTQDMLASEEGPVARYLGRSNRNSGRIPF